MLKQLFGSALISLVLVTGTANAALVVDTGVPNNTFGQLALDSNDWIAGQVNFSQSLQINSIKGYLDDLGSGGGNFNVVLYKDNGSNKIGNSLYSGTATYDTVGWNGLSGLNWSVNAGKYWVGFEVTDINAPSFVAAQYASIGLAHTAYTDGSNQNSYHYLDGLNFGVQVDATTVAAVPEPEAYAMLLAGIGLMGFMVRRRKSEQA